MDSKVKSLSLEDKTSVKLPQQVNSLFQCAAVPVGMLYIFFDFDFLFFFVSLSSADSCSAERRRQFPTHSRLRQSARKGAVKDRHT